MLPVEEQEGITFAELGIDISRCRDIANCVTECPQCHDTRTKPENRAKGEMSVNGIRGTWTCHHCGYRGGLGIAARAAGRVSRWKGNTATMTAPTNTKPIKTATPVGEETLPVGLCPSALAWLAERGISEATAVAFGVTAQGEKDAWTLHFPYRVNGKLVNVKHRTHDKKFSMVKGADPVLFNVDRAEGSDTVVIVEGEMDVLACHEAAWTAVSVPNGAPGRTTDKDTGEIKVASIGAKLDCFREAKSARVLGEAERIVIAVDADPEGQALRDAIIDALGPVRCWVVTWPDGCKDANDVLMRSGPEGLDECIGSARPVDLPGITEFMSEYDALLDIWHHGYDTGVETGWPELDQKFRPRRGTVTTVTGVPSNGKTTFTMALFANLAKLHNWKFALFSPESGPTGALFGKLVQLAADAPIVAGTDEQMSLESLQSGAAWVNKHFWRIDSPIHDREMFGYTVPGIIERMESLVLRHGITAAIVDPWNRLEASRNKNQTETEYVAWAISQFSRFAQRHNVAMFIVCHPHKLDAKYGEDEPIPSPYNIAGSAHWYNMSDYILGIGRKKHGEPRNETTVAVMKCREEGTTGALGDVFFYFDARSRRYYAQPEQIPLHAGTNPFPTDRDF